MSDFIIGVDGGASHTKGVLMSRDGKILSKLITEGTNLAIFQEKAPEILLDLISDISKKAGILKQDIAAIGLGLAGASNENGRDLVFKAFDKENLSSRLLISSDAEAAFRITCPAGTGVMISIGTGIICIGRDELGNIFRTAGKGHFKDKGSGFWMGDQILWQLSLSESTQYSDSDIDEILELIYNTTERDSFEDALKALTHSETRIPDTASLAAGICECADQNNRLALGIIQEATREAAEYLLEIRDMMHLNSEEIILGGNGSLLKNSLYRKNLITALKFDFKKIIWTFSDLSPEIGSALLAGDYLGIPLSISDILSCAEVNA